MEDICLNNSMQYNICEQADRLREIYALDLPQRMSENMIFRNISSEKNMLI